MPRQFGALNKGSNEFSRLYEQMVVEENINPVRVLFKLMKSRTQAIKLQAASNLLRYRFPIQASAKVEVEAAAQMVMTWDNDVSIPPPEMPELADGSEPDDRREFVRHDIEDGEFEEIPL